MCYRNSSDVSQDVVYFSYDRLACRDTPEPWRIEVSNLILPFPSSLSTHKSQSLFVFLFLPLYIDRDIDINIDTDILFISKSLINNRNSRSCLELFLQKTIWYHLNRTKCF